MQLELVEYSNSEASSSCWCCSRLAAFWTNESFDWSPSMEPEVDMGVDVEVNELESKLRQPFAFTLINIIIERLFSNNNFKLY